MHSYHLQPPTNDILVDSHQQPLSHLGYTLHAIRLTYSSVLHTSAIQLMNIVRIISLFYLGQYNETLFDWAHGYIWQALIMLDVLIVYLFWLRRVNKTANA